MTADSSQYGTVSARVGQFPSRLRRLLPGFRRIAVTRTGYDLFAPGDFLAYNDQRPRTEIKEICGVEVSRTYRAYPTNALGQAQEIEERAAFAGAPYGHASNPRTVKTYYAANAVLPLPGRLATVAYPGGKTETYGYEYGAFNASTFVFTPDPDGGAWRETVTTTYPTTPNSSIPTPQSTRSVRVWDEKGREVLDESYVEDGAAFALIGWKRMKYDRNCKLIETAYSDGRVVSATWGANCCGKESETSAEGIITVFGYNELKQKVIETKKGLAADGSGDITTLYTYDLEDRLILTAVTNFASGLGYVASRSAYDAVGRATNTVDRLGNTTITTYDALTTTVQQPNGMTAATERFLDGKIKDMLENGVVKGAYAYGVTLGGAQWSLSAQGAIPTVNPLTSGVDLRALAAGLDCPWLLTFRDALGRAISDEKPGFAGTVLVMSNSYDIAGNLLSATQYASQLLNPNLSILNAQTLYSYAADGALFLTALDLNTNGVIDLSGPDRVTGSSSVSEKDASNVWWQVSRSWAYPVFGASASVTTSEERVMLTGLGGAQGEGVLTALSRSLDIRSNATTSSTFINRNACKVTQTTSSPASIQPALQVSVNGLVVSNVSATAVATAYAYDALERRTLSETVSGASGERRVALLTRYNSLGQVEYVEDAASNRTSYAYDTLGRRVAVIDALSNTVHAVYDTDDHVIATWGAAYPVSYGYDTMGRMVEMGTYRGTTEITDYAEFQSLASSFDKTRWLFEQPTGLLTNKLYADGNGPSYAYTPDGKPVLRTWTRGITTAYGYDGAGDLAGVDYSDATPDIAYTYDRLGKMMSVTDASGTRTFSTAPDGRILTDTIQFQNEVFTLHEAYDAFGRGAGYALSNSVDGVSSLVTGVFLNYDELGRISEVSVADLPAPFRYGWLSGSDLQQSLAMPNGVTRQTTYDSCLDLLAAVTHTNAAGVVLVGRTFDYDTAGRLTGRTQYRLGDETNRVDAFGYNQRSELTSADLGTNVYVYAFDPIGNRRTATEPDFSAIYSANSLNQYTNIDYGENAVFVPAFDSDGNQTLVKTATGIWHVIYNAENHPIVFSNDTTVVEMAYDYNGRRFNYKETINGVVTRHENYTYRGYLQTSASDLLNVSNAQPRLIDVIVWDPSESTATRPLVLLQGTNWWTYSFDQVKNVTELFNNDGESASFYDYAPFGIVTSSVASFSAVSEFTFSSEVNDLTLGIIYYNYRYLNVADGRWTSRDVVGTRGGSINEFGYVNNDSSMLTDYVGLFINIYRMFKCRNCPDISASSYLDTLPFMDVWGRTERKIVVGGSKQGGFPGEGDDSEIVLPPVLGWIPWPPNNKDEVERLVKKGYVFHCRKAVGCVADCACSCNGGVCHSWTEKWGYESLEGELGWYQLAGTVTCDFYAGVLKRKARECKDAAQSKCGL